MSQLQKLDATTAVYNVRDFLIRKVKEPPVYRMATIRKYYPVEIARQRDRSRGLRNRVSNGVSATAKTLASLTGDRLDACAISATTLQIWKADPPRHWLVPSQSYKYDSASDGPSRRPNPPCLSRNFRFRNKKGKN